MSLEKTLALIKPHVFIDFQDRGELEIIANIQGRYLSTGLKITNVMKVVFDKNFVEEFYEEHRGKPFFNELIAAMCLGPGLAIVLEGENAVHTVRAVNGATNPVEAEVGTLRYIYGRKEKGPYNGLHSSDSPESAWREIALIFVGRERP
jgi:nucleoside-diphosphate kinase